MVRKADHPAKGQPPLAPYGRHRVVVPVHIPSEEGYFEHAREVLGLCLDSLRRTAGGRVAVTLVSDGSCPAVVEQLTAAAGDGWVDQVVVNEPNRGKVDAAVSAARASFEDLVTIADADVLFRPGWVDAVEQLFETFPECGYASVFPSPPGLFNLTSATLLGGWMSGATRFASVVDGHELDRFAESIGRPDLYPEHHRRVQLVVERDGVVACVGAPHFILTIRREVVEAIPHEPARDAIGGSETRWIDEPADRLGLWRLSTPGTLAQHMGNVPEPWMHEEVASMPEPVDDAHHDPGPLPPARIHPAGRIPWRARTSFVERVLRPLLERRIRARADRV